MKRFFALVMLFVMAICIGTPTWAVEITENEGTQSRDVTISTASTGDGIIYSVDITWGALKYTPAVAVWDTNTHTYSNPDSKWTCDSTTGADKITIANHSNTGINASVKFEPNSVCTAAFNDGTVEYLLNGDSATCNVGIGLPTANGAAASTEVFLGFKGVLSPDILKTFQSADNIGTVTVTITKAG